MPVTNEDLRTGLMAALKSEVLGVSRTPCPYQSSFALEKLEVTLVDGRELRMMFKDIGSEGKSVKPHFVYNPQREIQARLGFSMKVKTVPSQCRCQRPVELDDQQPDFLDVANEDGKGYACPCGRLWRMTLIGSGFHLYLVRDVPRPVVP